MSRMQQFKFISAKVDDIDEAANRALVIDSFGRKHVVPIYPRRGGGSIPQIGEQWILDRAMGELAFHSVLISNPPVVKSLAGLLQSLDDIGFIQDEYEEEEADEGGLSTYTPELTASVTNPSIGDGEIRGVFNLDGAVVQGWVQIEFGSGSDSGSGTWAISVPLPINSDYHEFLSVGVGDDVGEAHLTGSGAIISQMVLVAADENTLSFRGSGGIIDDSLGFGVNGAKIHLMFSYVTTDESAMSGVVEGAKWHVDSGSPPPSLGSLGDFYLNSTNGDVYNKQSFDTWVLTSNITGPQGSVDGLTTEGDLIYRDDTEPVRLPIGSPGELLRVNSGGNAPEWHTLPAVRRSRSSTQAIPDNTDTDLIWNTTVFDIGPTITFSTGRAVMPQAGLVTVKGGVSWSNDTGWRRFEIYHEGGSASAAEQIQSGATNRQVWQTISADLVVEESDEVWLSVMQDSGGSLNVLAGQRTFFSVVYLR